MSEKIFYFVRHGQSVGNIGPFRHTPHCELTEYGIIQSQHIANRCVNLNIQKLCSSPYQRAAQTAEIISKKIMHPIEFSELFVERRRPSAIVGKLKDDPYVKHIEKTIRDNFKSENFRFSDEENFYDLKERAIKMLSYLQEQPENRILVVTHCFFFRIVIASILLGTNFDAEHCLSLIKRIELNNSSLTIIKSDINHKLNLHCWNDCSHLP